MEQHPIPQNITGFEFKLIGDMTIKQFAYLAGCAAIAYLTFVSPLHPFVKFPLIGFFVLLGIGLAFVPVEGRPLDRWISNFIRALFAPSQYIFHKQGGAHDFLKLQTPQKVFVTTKPQSAPVSPRQASSEKFASFLQTLSPATRPVDQEERERLATIAQLANEPFAPPASPVLAGFSPSQQPATPTAPTIPGGARAAPSLLAKDPMLEEKISQERRLEEENRKLRAELEALKRNLQSVPATPPQVSTRSRDRLVEEALTIEKKLQQALSEKERLESELTKLQTKASSQPVSQPLTPTIAQAAKKTETVKIIPPQLQTDKGVAGFSQYPNIVSGIVKDAKGDVLPNIIVEVKDQTQNPVRAFKTNKLGQFSAATPLANGKYTITLEDPQNTYVFDVIGFELTGTTFAPLEILAKSEATNQRERLYQSLFGGRNG